MSQTFSLPVDFPPGSLILVAVSGGGDSVFMAHELARHAPEWELNLHLSHVNHAQRGEQDLEDAAFVRSLAKQLSAGFSALAMPSEVEGSHSLEARLRDGRLAALRAEAIRLGAVAIAFGHTTDDLAETFLLMALRGAGPTGLGSLRAKRWSEADRLWMLRPLLEWTRKEIRQSLLERGLSWREDPTNDQPLHRRNRLRARVMPLLAEEEPAVVNLLARSAHLCAEASDLLEAIAAEDLETALVAVDKGLILLRNDPLCGLSPPRLAVLLRVAWRRAVGKSFPLPPPGVLVETLGARIRVQGGDASWIRDDEAVHARIDREYTLLHSTSIDCQQALEFLMQSTSAAILLPDRSSVIPVANSSQRATSMQSHVILPDGQGVITTAVLERGTLPENWSPVSDSSQCLAFFDPLSIRRDLVLRVAGEGETIPIGNSSSKVVAEALQEAGIPPELRTRVAVLADERGPLWIPGVRRAVSAYVTDRSTFVLRLQWQKPPTQEQLT